MAQLRRDPAVRELYLKHIRLAALPEIGAGNYHVELVAFDPGHDDLVREDIRQDYRA